MSIEILLTILIGINIVMLLAMILAISRLVDGFNAIIDGLKIIHKSIKK